MDAANALLDRYRLAFDENPQPMWLVDQETLRFVDVNGAAVASYGYSRDEFLEMHITDIRPAGDVPALLQPLQTDQDDRRIWKHRTKGGTMIDVEISRSSLIVGGRSQCLVVARDISQQSALEEQLRQAQKFETVGQLAGGIAHEFNNLLTAILGHVEMLADDLAPGDPRAADVTGIRQSAELAASLTQQLLAFSRKQILQPTVLDLNQIVDRTRRILHRVIGEHIELVTCTSPDLWRVMADAGQIEQILLNLVVNARDAMPRGGLLTLQTQNVTFDEERAQRAGLEPGNYAQLSVIDTGVGIAPDVREHLFEPFFTTKERGRGTGLGLATVYGIVKQSGGHISADAESVHGARFDVYLPQTKAQAASLPGRGAQSDRGTETILLVEDDLAVRSLIGDVLRRRGYELLVAQDGSEALTLADNHSEAIHLLITDVVIPGMSGVAVAAALRARRPDTRVLYVSGYTADSPIDMHGSTRPAGFLHKPFTPDALARKVRSVLELGA
jgi:two-component system cell cycle sensor histidine kinase/response regulator CckA